MLGPWAKLQAMLQGILQGAGPVGCYHKVLTGCVIEREFRACWPLFLGVLFLDVLFWILFWRFMGYFLGFLSLLLGVLFLDSVIGGLRSWQSGQSGFWTEMSRLLRIVAGELWQANCGWVGFKGYFVKGSVRID